MATPLDRKLTSGTGLPARPLFSVFARQASLWYLITLTIFGACLVAFTTPRVTPSAARLCLEASPRQVEVVAGTNPIEVVPPTPGETTDRGELPTGSEPEFATPPLTLWLPKVGWSFARLFGVNAFFVIPMVCLCGSLVLFFHLVQWLANFRMAVWATLLASFHPIVLSAAQTPRPASLALLCILGALRLLCDIGTVSLRMSILRQTLAGLLLGTAALAAPALALLALGLLTIQAVLLAIEHRRSQDDFALDDDDWRWQTLPIVPIAFLAVSGWWFRLDILEFRFGSTWYAFFTDALPLGDRLGRGALTLSLLFMWPLILLGLMDWLLHRRGHHTARDRRSSGLRGESRDHPEAWRFVLIATVVLGVIGLVTEVFPFFAYSRIPANTRFLMPVVLLLGLWAGRGLETIADRDVPGRIGFLVLAFTLGTLTIFLHFAKSLPERTDLFLITLAVATLVATSPWMLTRSARRWLTERSVLSSMICVLIVIQASASLLLVLVVPRHLAAIRELDSQLDSRPVEQVVLMTSQAGHEPMLLALRTRWPKATPRLVRAWSDVSFDSTPDGSTQNTFLLTWGDYGVRPVISSLDRPLAEVLRPFYLSGQPIRGFRTQEKRQGDL